MTGKYNDYALMWYDDPYRECYEWFWQSLGEDETLPKAFLEHLQQLIDDINSGKEKLTPMDEDFMEKFTVTEGE